MAIEIVLNNAVLISYSIGQHNDVSVGVSVGVSVRIRGG